MGTSDPMDESYPHEYGYGVNLYPSMNINNLSGLFFHHRYMYGILILHGYLTVAISNLAIHFPTTPCAGHMLALHPQQHTPHQQLD